MRSLERRAEAAHGLVALLDDLGMPFYTLQVRPRLFFFEKQH
jgi:hypothetical protein